jgi:hypothetical protein
LCVFIWALRLLTLSNTLRHPKQHKWIKTINKTKWKERSKTDLWQTEHGYNLSARETEGDGLAWLPW